MAVVSRELNTEELQGRIRATVSDFHSGLRTFDHVELVRIKSTTYSLLIMEDYFPSVGSIHGVVDLVLADEVVHMPHIDGFYLHRNNCFSLMIEEGSRDRGEEKTEIEIQDRKDEDLDA